MDGPGRYESDSTQGISYIDDLPKAKKIKCGRGRPSGKVGRRIVRRNKRTQQKMKDLFDHRHLFVKKKLTPAERKILLRVTRGFPKLRNLRSITDEVYRLFDRRCRTDTALGKLSRVRTRVHRCRSRKVPRLH